MKKLSWLTLLSGCFLLVSIPLTPFASEATLRGQIMHQGRPAANATVTLSCSKETANTDSYGRFSATVDGSVACSIAVKWKERESEQVELTGIDTNRFINLQLRLYQDRWLLDLR